MDDTVLIFVDMFPCGLGRWHWISMSSDGRVIMRSTKTSRGFARTREHAFDVSSEYIKEKREK